MAKILAIIPARAGSKGIPDKNIKILRGKPLLVHSIETAQQVEAIDRIIVSTDSPRYANIAIEHGAEVPFLRPAEFAQDHSNEYGFVMQLLDFLIEKDEKFEFVILLPPTTPLRDPKLITLAIEAIKNCPEADALSCVNETPSLGYCARIIENGFLKDYKTDSFDLDPTSGDRHQQAKTYSHNGYCTIHRVSSFRKYGTLSGKRVLAFLTPDSIDIDTPLQFDYLEFIFPEVPFQKYI